MNKTMQQNKQQPQPGYFAVLPATVRYDKRLIPNAKLLYGEVTALCGVEGYCDESNFYFAELFNVTTRTIQYWIEQLVEFGYFNRVFIRDEVTNEVISRQLYIQDVPKSIIDANYKKAQEDYKNEVKGGEEILTTPREEILATPVKKSSPFSNNYSNTSSSSKVEEKRREKLVVKDTTRKKEEKEEVKIKIKSKTREKRESTFIDPDFKIGAQLQAWIDRKYPFLTTQQLEELKEEFIDYWLSVSDVKFAKKADWDATFRNHMRFKATKFRFVNNGEKSSRVVVISKSCVFCDSRKDNPQLPPCRVHQRDQMVTHSSEPKNSS